MLYRTLTLDQLMQLDAPTLTYALRIFQQELTGTIAFLSQDTVAQADEPTLDDLGHLLTLRKAFQGRLEELVAEQQAAAPVPASEQFQRNELEPALA